MNETKIVFINAVNMFGRAIDILILVRIIMSWIPPLRNNTFGRIVFSVTEPILAPIRNLIARSPLGGPGMMLDFSPIIAIFAIQLVSRIVIEIIIML